MATYYIRDNRMLMEVTSVKKLFQSSLVHDVITKDGKFVVDLKTNELTIYRKREGDIKIVNGEVC